MTIEEIDKELVERNSEVKTIKRRIKVLKSIKKLLSFNLIQESNLNPEQLEIRYEFK